MNYLAGLVSYALFVGDIEHEESTQLHSRINAARTLRVSRLCQSAARVHA
jgi:hypothetical protein